MQRRDSSDMIEDGAKKQEWEIGGTQYQRSSGGTPSSMTVKLNTY